MKRKLNISQWVSVFSLTAGVSMVQLSQQAHVAVNLGRTSNMIGVLSVVLATLTSGLAGGKLNSNPVILQH